MNESNLWEWLRDIALPYGHYSRIESPDTAPGFPDVHYQVGEKGTGTLELKATDRALKVPFPNEEKGLHKSQLRWIKDNLKHGGIVWIIAEVPGVIYLLHGKHAKWFNGATHDQLIEMAWSVLNRDNPRTAAKTLNAALRTPTNFRLYVTAITDD